MKKTAILLFVLILIMLAAVGCGRRSTTEQASKTTTGGKSETTSNPGEPKQPGSTDPASTAQNSIPLPANPTAKAIINRTAQTYKGIKTLQMDVEIQASQAIGKEKRNNTANISLSLERPNKMKMVTNTGSIGSTMVTDGKHAYAYSPSVNQYQEIPAPKDVFGGGQKGKGDLSTMDLLAGKDVNHIANKAKLVKSEKIGGVDTYLIEAVLDQTPSGSITKERTWIGKNDSLIYRTETSRTISVADQVKEQQKMLARIEAQAKAAGQKIGPRPTLPKPQGPVSVIQKTFVKKITTNVALPSSTFRFTPPKGAKKFDPSKVSRTMPPQPQQRIPQSAPQTASAPSFSIPSLDGKQISLSQFRGKPVLVAFWSTLSQTSKDGMPNIQKLYDSVKGSGISVLGISLDGDKSAVQKYVKSSRITFPILFDKEQTTQIAQAFSGGQLGIPSVYVIGKDGSIKGVFALGKENRVNGKQVSDPAKYMKSELSKLGIK
jgi:peroxiredoxin/outer membrane lipoprotein-sorting protein